MLKKDGFQSSEETKLAFHRLKEVVTQTLRFGTSRFFKAPSPSSMMPQGQYVSATRSAHCFLKPDLKGEIPHDVNIRKRTLCLGVGNHQVETLFIEEAFVVKTDQHSLKHLLDQNVRNPMQQRWIMKILRYDFVMEYKKGSKTSIAYTQSSKGTMEEVGLMLITFTSVEWVD